MEKLRVCIGSKDGENIPKTHLGDSPFFYIYDIFEGSEPEFIEKRENTARGMDHMGSDKMKKIIEIVGDVDLFVANRKSPNFANLAKKTRYQPVVIKTSDIREAIGQLQKSFRTLYEYASRKKAGELSGEILEL